MSSLVETTSQEEAPISAAHSIAGRRLNTHTLLKRPWGSYHFINFPSSRSSHSIYSQRRIRSPKIRTKTGFEHAITKPCFNAASIRQCLVQLPAHITAAQQVQPTPSPLLPPPPPTTTANYYTVHESESKDFEEFVSSLSKHEINHPQSTSQTDVDELVTMLQKNYVSDNLPVMENTHQNEDSLNNTPLVSFNFSFSEELQSHLPDIYKQTFKIPVHLPSSSSWTPEGTKLMYKATVTIPLDDTSTPYLNNPMNYKFSVSANVTRQQDTADPATHAVISTCVPELYSHSSNSINISSIPSPSSLPMETLTSPPTLFSIPQEDRQTLYSAPYPALSVTVESTAYQPPTAELNKDEKTGEDFTHLQHRRILPMPKPHRQRALKKMQQGQDSRIEPNTHHTTTTPVWHFQSTPMPVFGSNGTVPPPPPSLNSPVSSSIEQPSVQPIAQLPAQFSSLKLESNDKVTPWIYGQNTPSTKSTAYEPAETPQSLVEANTNYGEGTKKIKRSGVNEVFLGTESEERKDIRRKSKGKKVEADAMLSEQFPGGILNFSLDEKTKEKLKQVPMVGELAPPMKQSIGLTQVLQQTLYPVAHRPIARPTRLKDSKQAIVSTSSPFPLAFHSSLFSFPLTENTSLLTKAPIEQCMPGTFQPATSHPRPSIPSLQPMSFPKTSLPSLPTTASTTASTSTTTASTSTTYTSTSTGGLPKTTPSSTSFSPKLYSFGTCPSAQVQQQASSSPTHFYAPFSISEYTLQPPFLLKSAVERSTPCPTPPVLPHVPSPSPPSFTQQLPPQLPPPSHSTLPTPTKSKKSCAKKKKGKQTSSHTTDTPTLTTTKPIQGPPGTKKGKKLQPSSPFSPSSSPPSSSHHPLPTLQRLHRRKNREEHNGLLSDPYYDLSSEVSMVKSVNPDDWTCLFCQFEIFCNGIEAARRKGGYYRRRKERQRKGKEMAARLYSSEQETERGGGGYESQEAKKTASLEPLASLPGVLETMTLRPLRRTHPLV
ncbi:hypothetical protein BDF14DRAFT_1882207 [Spinellus fusiger]|nr:hypothetical protein BDF14DRAFT_1882207 [Spinellus fusiger]